MTQWLAENYSTALIVLGLALLAIEVMVLGFAVFVLFFIGLACIVTGLLTALGILPETPMASFGGVAALSLVFAFSLWGTLKKLQNTGIHKEVKGDLIGNTFVLDSDVSNTVYGSHRMSGVNWKVKSVTPLSAGTEVEVIKLEVGELTVALKA